MGKSKKKLNQLEDINKLQKQNMKTFLGGEEIKSKKKRWFGFICGGILNQ